MSDLEVAALVAVAVWLAVLSFANVLLVRQIGLLSAWAQRSASAGQEGLDVGLPVPEPATEVWPDLTGDLFYVAFLDGDCQPCREFALEAGRSDEFAALRAAKNVSAVVAGRGSQADEVAAMLPDWVRVARAQQADVLKEAFLVETTPSVYEVDRGIVTGTAVAGYGLINFLNLVDARETSNAGDIATRRLEDLEVEQVNTATSGG